MLLLILSIIFQLTDKALFRKKAFIGGKWMTASSQETYSVYGNNRFSFFFFFFTFFVQQVLRTKDSATYL